VKVVGRVGRKYFEARSLHIRARDRVNCESSPHVRTLIVFLFERAKESYAAL